jgi:hypothetical protein
VSRIRVTIDRLVLNGVPPLESKALTHALQSHLSHALADRDGGHGWGQSRRTPVLRLTPMALAPGTAGASTFGRGLARAVARGVKP